MEENQNELNTFPQPVQASSTPFVSPASQLNSLPTSTFPSGPAAPEAVINPIPVNPIPVAPVNTAAAQPYYVGSMPVEEVSAHPGRAYGTIGIICALISTLLFPPVFGLAGIVLGIICLKKGNKKLGIITIILSVFFMVVGMLAGAAVNKSLQIGAFLFGALL